MDSTATPEITAAQVISRTIGSSPFFLTSSGSAKQELCLQNMKGWLQCRLPWFEADVIVLDKNAPWKASFGHGHKA